MAAAIESEDKDDFINTLPDFDQAEMEKLFEPIKDIIQRLTSAREFKPLFLAKGVKIHNIIAKSPEDIFSMLY